MTRSISTPSRWDVCQFKGYSKNKFSSGDRYCKSVPPKNITQCSHPRLKPGAERTTHEAITPPLGHITRLKNPTWTLNQPQAILISCLQPHTFVRLKDILS